MPPVISPTSANGHSTNSRRPSLLLPFSLTSSQMPNWWLRLTHWTMRSLVSYPSQGWMMRYDHLHSTLTLWPHLNWIMITTTRSSLLSSRPSKSGITTWRALPSQLTSWLTTKIWSIFLPLRFSPVGKPDGQNTSALSIWSFVSNLVNLVQSLMPWLDTAMSTPKREIGASPESIHRTSNQCSWQNSSPIPFTWHTYTLQYSELVHLWTLSVSMPTLEFHLDGFHWATPILIWLHSHTGTSHWLTIKASHIHPNSQYNNLPWAHTALPTSCLC